MPILQTVQKHYQSKGIKGVFRLFKTKLFPPKIDYITNFDRYKPYFEGKKGIEIGGTSAIFSREINIYPLIAGLDGCNFSTQTVWEGRIQEGQNYAFYENKKGYQYICEASNLSTIPDGKYDFLVASHCLEHCANALKTVEEWLRVVRKGGAILLVLPNRDYTFDHRREITPFQHLLDDYTKGIDEKDLTHLEEIIAKHDLSMDSFERDIAAFRERSLQNYENRCLHHHVFDLRLLKEIYQFFHLETIDTALLAPYHQVILGIKK